MTSDKKQEFTSRYLAALNLQYTAFKEMLIGFTHGKYLPADILTLNPSGGAEISYSALFPYQASEAYLFMPSGYWPSVYDNTMYPSDFPTDILASMNDGEQKYAIKGTCANGQYLMLFCIDNQWYKTIYSIQEGKVTSFNEFTVENEKSDAVIHMECLKVRTYIDINPARFNDLPTSFSVIRSAENSLPTSAHVFACGYDDIATEAFIRYKSYSNINTSFMLYNKSDIPTSCHVHEYGTKCISTEAYIMAYGEYGIPIELVCAAIGNSDIPCEIDVNECRIDEIPTEFTIKVDAEYRLPTELTIKKDEENSIPTSINVLVHATEELPASCVIKVYVDKKYIPISFIVKQNIAEDIPTSIHVRGKLSTELASSFNINHYDGESRLPISLIIKQNVNSGIDTSFIINPYDYMESVISDAASMGSYDILTLLEVKYDCSSDIPTAFAIPESNTMIAVASDALNNGINDVPTSFYVKRDAYAEIATSFAIMLNNGMEAIIDDCGKSGISNVPTEIEVVFAGKSEIPAVFVLQAYNLLEAKLQYRNPQYSDISTSFFVYAVADIPTSFAVIPINTMETRSRSYPACKKIVTSDIIKDSTVYSKTPASNFGFISDIYVANKHNVQTGMLDTYKSVIGFNASDTGISRPYDSEYFGYNMIIKAELKLFINRRTTDDIVLDVFQIDYDTWEEYKVNYKQVSNMPTDKHVNTVTVPAGSYGYCRIDVSSAFNNWNNIGDKFSFLLSSDTISGKEILSFSSREGYYTPQLALTYYKYYPYADNSDILSEIDVKPEDRLPTSFELVTPEEKLLPTEFEIEENIINNDLLTELFIDGMTFENSDMPTEWDMIFYPSEDDLPTSFEVNFTTVDVELPIEFEIERDYSYGCYVIII